MPFTFNFDTAAAVEAPTANDDTFCFDFDSTKNEASERPQKRVKSSNAEPKRLEERDKAVPIAAENVTFTAEELAAETSPEASESVP